MTRDALSTLTPIAGWDAARASEVEFTADNDPILPTPFRIGETAAASLAAVGLAVSDIWKLRTGRGQDVGVDVRRATASLRSSKYMTKGGKSIAAERQSSDGSISREGRALELPALQFPQPPRRGVVRSGRRRRRQRRRAESGVKVGRAGTRGSNHRGWWRGRNGAFDWTNWARHPQSAAVASLPLLEITKIGDSQLRTDARWRSPIVPAFACST